MADGKSDTTVVPCDDADVMRVWRECGLPEYFLGNAGTNHELVEFARRLRLPIRVEAQPFVYREEDQHGQ
jgi:hypothetical protein